MKRFVTVNERRGAFKRELESSDDEDDHSEDESVRKSNKRSARSVYEEPGLSQLEPYPSSLLVNLDESFIDVQPSLTATSLPSPPSPPPPPALPPPPPAPSTSSVPALFEPQLKYTLFNLSLKLTMFMQTNVNYSVVLYELFG